MYAPVNNRNSVVNRTYGRPQSNPALNGGGPASSSMADYSLERQNDEHVENLSQKMGLLKEISLQIGDEVNSQNALLGQMQDDFSRTGGFLGATMKQLNALTRTQDGRWMCYLILFALGCFFFLYLLFRR